MKEAVAQLKPPEWDDYYMGSVFYHLLRSPDPATKHCALLTEKDHSPISWGYNGPARNMRDELIPWTKRPDKYFFSIHSEDNAFKNGNRKYYEDCTLYVTGFPCHQCWLNILQHRVSRIVYGPQGSVFGRQTDYCPDGDDRAQIKRLLDLYKGTIEIVQYEGDILKVLFESILYFVNRVSGDDQAEREMQLGEWVVSLHRRGFQNACI